MTKMLVASLLGLCFATGALFAEHFPGPNWKEGPDPDASPYAVPGGTLVFAGYNPPKSFNVYLDNNTSTSMVFALMYPTLLAIDTRTGDYGPSLADWWEISDDKRLYTFHIDERAKWSDGSPITAYDVKETFDAVMAPESLAGSFKVVFAALESPTVIDDRTIVFPCKEVHWRNLSVLGGSLYVMPKKLIDAAKAKARQAGTDEKLAFNSINFQLPIVGGPYHISDHKEGQSMTLTRNADWWGFATPSGQGVYNFEKIRIRFFMDRNNAYEAFLKGEVDAFAVYSASVWNTKSVGERYEKNWIVKQNVQNHEPIGFQGLAFNMRHPPFDDLRVRKAIAHLFDRRRMVRTLMYNSYFMMRSYYTDLYDAVHPCNTPMYEYDPDRAYNYLKETGYVINPATGKMEKDGKPLVVRILTQTNDRTYLAIFKESLDRLGIDLEIEQIDFATWMRRTGDITTDPKTGKVDKAFDVTASAFSGSIFRDPEPMWGSQHADIPNGVNLCGFKDARVDEIIEQQKTEFSVAKRNDLIREVDSIVTEAVPYILTWGVNSTRLLYWNKFGTPTSILGKYGDEMSIPSYWWYDADSARELEEAMKKNHALPGRLSDVQYDAVTIPPATSASNAAATPASKQR